MVDRIRTASGDRSAGWIFVVLLVAFAVHAPALVADFCWDDRWAAMGHSGTARHPLVGEMGSVADYFGASYWPHKTPAAHTYRPLTTWTFALRHALCGDSAHVAHLVNNLLHVLATLLGYVVLRRLGARSGVAALASLAFAVHAVHSEAVVGIVGRAELLGFCGGAAALLALWRWNEASAVGRTWRGVLAGVAIFAACCGKESAVAWVAFVPLCLGAGGRLAGIGPRAGVALGIALALPAALFLALRVRMIAALPVRVDPTIGHLENPLLFVDATTRVLSGVVAWGHGLLLTLLPVGLSVDYGPWLLPLVRGPADASLWLAALALVAVLIGGLLAARRAPLLFLAGACFLGFSFVVTNIPFPVFMMFGERTYYTPSFGLALAIAGVAPLLPRPTHPAWLLAAGAWIGFSAHQTVQRALIWRDDPTLIRHEVEAHPRSVRMQLCAAELHAEKGELAAAVRRVRRATELDPDEPHAWLELARLHERRRDHDGAREALERALRGRPVDRDRILDELEVRLARALLALGRVEDARAVYRRGAARSPQLFAAAADLSAALGEPAAPK